MPDAEVQSVDRGDPAVPLAKPAHINRQCCHGKSVPRSPRFRDPRADPLMSIERWTERPVRQNEAAAAQATTMTG
ncbi:hypothetical protein GCM10010326_46460 [Streptomyces xanthochromogenes]|uniref:Uncharacterized protein n=1 Tax=Streptomyces xanthochromogenes TaxID=67384 RepID=A0ABQ3AD66_9ACTN|nr:hypothetical protein GCM10010326_46460 [Streptomyces xanthochromogenes]